MDVRIFAWRMTGRLRAQFASDVMGCIARLAAAWTQHKLNTPVLYAFHLYYYRPTHWPDPISVRCLRPHQIDQWRAPNLETFSEITYFAIHGNLSPGDKCDNGNLAQRHLEYVRNINYSTDKSFQSVRIKFVIDIIRTENESVVWCRLALNKSYGICGDLWASQLSLKNGPIRSKALSLPNRLVPAVLWNSLHYLQ